MWIRSWVGDKIINLDHVLEVVQKPNHGSTSDWVVLAISTDIGTRPTVLFQGDPKQCDEFLTRLLQKIA